MHYWFEKALDGSGIVLLPITPETAHGLEASLAPTRSV